MDTNLVNQLKVEVFDILREQSEIQQKMQPFSTQLQGLEAKKNEKLKELAVAEGTVPATAPKLAE